MVYSWGEVLVVCVCFFWFIWDMVVFRRGSLVFGFVVFVGFEAEVEVLVIFRIVL